LGREAAVKELVGMRVSRLEVADGEQYLRFVGEDGRTVCYEAEGDCCSTTWFADILNPGFVVGHQVLSVEQLEMPEGDPEDGRTRQESDQLYGFRITTLAGACDVVFRNSSNGYYGGWLVLNASPPATLAWKEVWDKDRAREAWRAPPPPPG
jgi:hypothetical protein